MAEQTDNGAAPTDKSEEVKRSSKPLSIKTVQKVVDDRYKQDEDLRAEWEVFDKMFRNEYWITEKGAPEALRPHESPITGNVVFANVETIAPMMTDNRPVWFVRGTRAYIQPLANVWNDALRYSWTFTHMDEKISMVYKNALIKETGIFKVSWDPDHGVSGDVAVGSVDPSTFVFAEGYDDLDEVPWCGEKSMRPLSYLWQRYGEKARKIKPTHKGDTQVTDIKGFEYREDLSPIEMTSMKAPVYEVWFKSQWAEELMIEQVHGKDVEPEEPLKGQEIEKNEYPHGRFVTFAGEGDDCIILDDRPSVYRHSLPPYVMVYNYRNTTGIWGMGEIRAVKGIVMEIQKMLQTIATFVNNNLRQNYFGDGTQVNQEDVAEKWFEGNHIFWTRKTMEGNAPDPVRAAKVASLPTEIISWLKVLLDLFEEITGVTDTSKGLAEKRARQSAREIDALMETSNTRTRQRVRNLEASLKRVLERMMDVMMQFYTDDRPVANIGDDGSVAFSSISNSLDFAKAAIGDAEAHRTSEKDNKRQLKTRADDSIKRLIDVFGETNEVYANFDIEIQTNSTLPLDKQSLANLALRLGQIKMLDAEGVLETLNFPKWQEVVQRLEQEKQDQIKAKSGGKPLQPRPQQRPGTAPGNVTDISDRLTSGAPQQ